MMKKRLPILLTMLLFGFYLIGQGYILTTSPNASPVETRQKRNALYEEKLKKLVFKDQAGKKYGLSKKMPKVVIVNFWASWCVPCLEEFPSLVKLQDKYKDNKDFLILAINTDDSEIEKKINKMKNRFKLNFPIIEDRKGKFVDEFSISAIPVSIIYKDGKVFEVSNKAKDFVGSEFLEKLKEWNL